MRSRWMRPLACRKAMPRAASRAQRTCCALPTCSRAFHSSLCSVAVMSSQTRKGTPRSSAPAPKKVTTLACRSVRMSAVSASNSATYLAPSSSKPARIFLTATVRSFHCARHTWPNAPSDPSSIRCSSARSLASIVNALRSSVSFSTSRYSLSSRSYWAERMRPRILQ